jgi:hypothetical protein
MAWMRAASWAGCSDMMKVEQMVHSMVEKKVGSSELS